MNKSEYNKHSHSKHNFLQRRHGVRPDANNEQFLSNLSAAIRNNELQLHYQPRYDSLSGHANILEALVRWERPGLGTFYPNTFLRAAETHGLIFALDLWVFEQCCKDLIQYRKTLSPQLKIAVNISSLDCESVYYSQKLIDLCNHYQLKLADFIFEISETHAINDIRKTIAFCKTLNEYNTRFCLGGFGTGYASIIRLLELPTHYLEIDYSFISQIGESEHSETIIKNILKLARTLRLKTIAVGVEHKYQYDFLMAAGCDLMQGFYFISPGEINPGITNKINKSSLFMSDKKKF